MTPRERALTVCHCDEDYRVVRLVARAVEEDRAGRASAVPRAALAAAEALHLYADTLSRETTAEEAATQDADLLLRTDEKDAAIVMLALELRQAGSVGDYACLAVAALELQEEPDSLTALGALEAWCREVAHG